jgi:hypothetical protein
MGEVDWPKHLRVSSVDPVDFLNLECASPQLPTRQFGRTVNEQDQAMTPREANARHCCAPRDDPNGFNPTFSGRT